VTTALYDEVQYTAVNDAVVVITATGISEKVGDSNRSLIVVKLDIDRAEVGNHVHGRCGRGLMRTGSRDQKGTGRVAQERAAVAMAATV